MSPPSLVLSDKLSGDSGGYAIGGNVVCHYAVGTNDGSVADGYAGQHANVVAEPHVVADDDRAFTHHRTLARGQLQVFAGVESVGIVGNQDVSARQQVVADGDAVGSSDVAIGTNQAVAAYSNAARWLGGELYLRVDVRIIAYADALKSVEFQSALC